MCTSLISLCSDFLQAWLVKILIWFFLQDSSRFRCFSMVEDRGLPLWPPLVWLNCGRWTPLPRAMLWASGLCQQCPGAAAERQCAEEKRLAWCFLHGITRSGRGKPYCLLWIVLSEVLGIPCFLNFIRHWGHVISLTITWPMFLKHILNLICIHS